VIQSQHTHPGERYAHTKEGRGKHKRGVMREEAREEMWGRSDGRTGKI